MKTPTAKTSAIAHLLIDRVKRYRRYLVSGDFIFRMTPSSATLMSGTTRLKKITRPATK